MRKIDVILLILLGLLIVGAIAFGVWFFVVWGNTPVGELPSWLWWLMN